MMRVVAVLLLALLLLVGLTHGFVSPPARAVQCTSSSLLNMANPQERENEIRRKILKLKRQGRINKQEDSSDVDKMQRRKSSSSASEDYAGKLKAKLGKKKASMMGFNKDDNDEELDEIEAELESYEQEEEEVVRKAQLGSLPRQERTDNDNDESTYEPPETTASSTNEPIIDPSLFEYEEDEDNVQEPDEEDLVELVAQKLKEQRAREKQEEERLRQERLAARSSSTSIVEDDSSTLQQTTSGVGGAWSKTNSTQNVETYQPKTGSWGAFPRPKDISKAYGGGRRVGAGFDKEIDLTTSIDDTKERLRQYREKVGIEVQSEKDHADEIDEALRIAGYAMQRGMYSSAVSCLEKVTKYCSTNSKVGGKVFLELAMAYEAEGRTQEAVTVYTTLTKCRIEEIKFDAKRLLYGIEAMQFMRNEARSEAFSRKKIRNTFIDTTGLDHIAENFDDVYETAYIDLSSGFYRRLTESVVRSNREARQILLQATGSGMMEHMKIVQALRSLARHFDSALEEELKAAAPQSVAVMNGKPIVERESSVATVIAGMDEFVLASPDQMLEMLNGDWRLQLTADRQGDGVKYDNNATLQTVDTDSMTFSSSGPAGFVKVSQSGGLEFQPERRILSKANVNTSGGGVLSGLMGGGKSNSLTAAQQVISVDSTLLIMRRAPDKKRSAADGNKGHFSVWRRVGTPVLTTENELEVQEA